MIFHNVHLTRFYLRLYSHVPHPHDVGGRIFCFENKYLIHTATFCRLDCMGDTDRTVTTLQPQRWVDAIAIHSAF